MSFHRPGSTGVVVWKIASRESGAPTANRLLAAPGASGAGASASRIALVTVMTVSRAAKTMTLRCEPWCRALPSLALRVFLATFVAAGKTPDPRLVFGTSDKTPEAVFQNLHRPALAWAFGKSGQTFVFGWSYYAARVVPGAA